MRLTEPKPKTWLGAVPKLTRLIMAIVLLNGSLTNSCRTTVPCEYGFIMTPNRGSTPGESSQLRPTVDWTVPAFAKPSSPLNVCSWTIAPSAVTTTNTALHVPSGEGPSKAVPTAPVLSEPLMTCRCCGKPGGGEVNATTSRFVRPPT